MDFDTKVDFVNITDEELIKQVEQEYETALEFRKPRISDWHANEDMLYGRKQKTLSNRSNIDLRLMRGFENTLLAKIKNPPIVRFKATEDADKRKAKKITALWELESSPTRENWKFKDLSGKKSGLISGRVIDKIVPTTPYRHKRERVDHYDYLIDPLAGGLDIERARYMGQDNILKTRDDLERNEEYDQARVKELIAANENGDHSEEQDVDNRNSEKANRFGILGLDLKRHAGRKGGVYKMLEWYTTINGSRYYVFCNLEKRKIIKRCPLEDIVGIHEEGAENPLWPFESWAYFPDEFNFWSPAPMDDVRENFQVRNVVINQAIDNNEAKNKPMKSYDPDTYKNKELLKYRPDGLVPTAKGKDPARGLFVHPVNNIYDPKVLNDILEDIASKVTGVTPANQGVEEGDQKVGIYYGNLEESADRMSLFEESYTRAQIGLAKLYLNVLRDRMTEPLAVRMVGEKGAEWEKVMSEDLSDFDIEISGGVTEAQNDAVQKKAKMEYFAKNIGNPALNPKWRTEQELAILGYGQMEIKQAMEQEEVDEDLLSEASQDIQRLLNGEKVSPNPKATAQYMQKILDFYNKTELKPEQEKRFRMYLDLLVDVAIKNMVRKATLDAAKARIQAATQMALSGQPMPAAAPGGLQPNTAGATIARASEMTNTLKPAYAQPV